MSKKMLKKLSGSKKKQTLYAKKLLFIFQFLLYICFLQITE